MAPPFNVFSHPQDTILLACYHDRIAQILRGLELGLRWSRQCWRFSKKFLQCPVASSVLSYIRYSGRCSCTVEVPELLWCTSGSGPIATAYMIWIKCWILIYYILLNSSWYCIYYLLVLLNYFSFFITLIRMEYLMHFWKQYV